MIKIEYKGTRETDIPDNWLGNDPTVKWIVHAMGWIHAHAAHYSWSLEQQNEFIIRIRKEHKSLKVAYPVIQNDSMIQLAQEWGYLPSPSSSPNKGEETGVWKTPESPF